MPASNKNRGEGVPGMLYPTALNVTVTRCYLTRRRVRYPGGVAWFFRGQIEYIAVHLFIFACQLCKDDGGDS